VLAAATVGGPSWYWYATRGLGIAALITLTGAVVLGIGTVDRWRSDETPGFVLANLHRNLSLLSVVIVVAHVVTTLLDPYAQIKLRDAIIPVGANYRPVWLGLGVCALEILIAVAATSLLRAQLGLRLWRLIHWTAYGSWPLAVIHGLGTGSDAQAPWLIGLVTTCVAGVTIALSLRLLHGKLSTLPIRASAAILALATLYLMAGWAFQGPFQPGWTLRAGTPQVSAKPGPVHPGTDGFSDALVGVMVRDASGNTQISMRDSVDTALTLAIRSPASNETLPVVTVARDGRQLCAGPANVGPTLYAVCGTTRLTITLFGSEDLASSVRVVIPGTSNITGRLDTSGPLT
jgi:methionine sulfoxide reductase heme-binding subunit